MRAIVQEVPGNENSLQIGEVTMPSPLGRELLIRVSYAALNQIDLLQAKNPNPQLPPGSSKIIGVEVSGVVIALGEKCENGFKVGDRVCTLMNGGGYAEFACCDEGVTFKVNATMSMAVAASIPETYITAYKLLFVVARVQPGDRILLHAAASSVGQALIQLAVRKGIVVYATARSDEKCEVCRRLGASATFNVKDNSAFANMVITANGGPINCVLCPVGSDYISENVVSLAMDGKYVFYGFLSGTTIKDPALLGKLMAKRISLFTTTLRNRSTEFKEKIVKCLLGSIESFGPDRVGDGENIIEAIEKGELDVPVFATFPLDKVKEAHAMMASSRNIGKIVLEIAGGTSAVQDLRRELQLKSLI